MIYFIQKKYVNNYFFIIYILKITVEILQGYEILTRKMSNSVGQNLIQQHFLRPTVLEHQSKLKNSSGVPTNSFCATASLNQSPAQPRKYKLSTKFYGNSISERKQKLAMGSQRTVKFIPQAVLAADPAYEVKIFCLLMFYVFENLQGN